MFVKTGLSSNDSELKMHIISHSLITRLTTVLKCLQSIMFHFLWSFLSFQSSSIKETADFIVNFHFTKYAFPGRP